MRGSANWVRAIGMWLAPSILFVCFCISLAIGVHRVVHMGRAAAALAGDPGCKTEIMLATAASTSGGCRIVHGAIVRAYEEEEGTQYHGGTAYDQYLVFAAPDGGRPVDFRVKRSYSSQPQPPPGPAVAEYVDGEIDYVTSATATIGPVFDPKHDTDLGWFLIVLGAFFFLAGASVLAFAFLQARGRTRTTAGKRSK